MKHRSSLIGKYIPGKTKSEFEVIELYSDTFWTDTIITIYKDMLVTIYQEFSNGSTRAHTGE